MTVHFIGAGPGAADLITVRGQALVRRAKVVLYAGSLVPRAVIALAPKRAHVVDTAPLTLDEIVAEIAAAHAAGHDVARLHSGDPSLYGAYADQPQRRGKAPFRNVSIANADSQGFAYFHSAVQEGYRAVQDLP